MWDCAEGRCLMSELHMGSERPLIGVLRHCRDGHDPAVQIRSSVLRVRNSVSRGGVASRLTNEESWWLWMWSGSAA